MKNYDLAPVVEFLVARQRDDGRENFSPEREAYKVIGAAIGLNWDSVSYRRRRGKGLTESEADRVAVALGLHPSGFWPEWGTVDIHAGKRLCANPKCGGWFYPRRAFQKYHDRNCGDRHRWSLEVSSPGYTPQKRKPVERTESRLAYERVMRRRYYARNREAERERQRRYYQANREKEQARKARYRQKAA